jgi:hypothetical protein
MIAVRLKLVLCYVSGHQKGIEFCYVILHTHTQYINMELLLVRNNSPCLVRIFKQTLRLVDPNSIKALVNDFPDLFLYLRLFVVRQNGNVALARSSVDNDFLVSLKFIGPCHFLWWIESSLVRRSIESLAPVHVTELWGALLVHFYEIPKFGDPSRPVPCKKYMRSAE